MPVRPLPDPSWEDLELLMWHFWTPTTQEDPHAPRYGFHHAPTLAHEYRVPPEPKVKPLGTKGNCPVYFPAREVDWQSPPFYGKHYPIPGELCIIWYETWTEVISYVVPDTYNMRIDAIGAQWPGPIERYELNEWRLLIDGNEAARWEDMTVRVPTALNPDIDPSKGVSFGSTLQMVPVHFIAGPGTRVTLEVLAHGRLGMDANGNDIYPHEPDDLFMAYVYAEIDGWMSNRMDLRSVPPYPVDSAWMRDNNGNPVLQREDLAFTDRLLQFLHAAKGEGDGVR